MVRQVWPLQAFLKSHWLYYYMTLGTSTVKDIYFIKSCNTNWILLYVQSLVQLFKFMSHYLHFALNNGFISWCSGSCREFIKHLKLRCPAYSCPPLPQQKIHSSKPESGRKSGDSEKAWTSLPWLHTDTWRAKGLGNTRSDDKNYEWEAKTF